mmetsp:Transcript_10625/g.15339  ORF Transcript_10625/g.15339 Transcript_10625/m.15339 type:complete len:600 (+) Transcript_10625:25-1824(+)|eukprot:CAMPEP_0175112836 /NCGR_PEP_ID=MMETSP0086_2-20121207/15763_1 /TAXON_ID=136419 /ORGANISM="Unknown Unknown, Strain D1" /LENGTH=599 /DNA_ID=CAMNT_0016391901 /DNA_START=24 /DNA_END=1823 /DNA_ORIENTATION=-
MSLVSTLKSHSGLFAAAASIYYVWSKSQQDAKDRKQLLEVLREASLEKPVQSTEVKTQGRGRSYSMSYGRQEGSVKEVGEWLLSLNAEEFRQYVPIFAQAGVNGAALAVLDDKTLEQELGVKSALHRRVILSHRTRAALAEAELSLPPRDTTKMEALNVDVLNRKMGLVDCDLSGKRLLIRVDYNVPMKNGVITDTSRIDATIPTLKYIFKQNEKYKADGRAPVKSVALVCHFGRPDASLPNLDKSKYTLKPCADKLAQILGSPVQFLDDCVGPEVEKAVNSGEDCALFMLENVRFHLAETGGEDCKIKTVVTEDMANAFAGSLTRMCDVFVFEAFGAAHRPHLSVVGVKAPERVAGLLMKKEMDTFANVLGKPRRPFLAIVGGSKVSDKIAVLENLLNIVDELVIGGGMAYTFKKVLDGVAIGGSLFDSKSVETVKRIAKKARERGIKLHLPIDHITASKFPKNEADLVNINIGYADDEEGIPEGWMGLDIGPQSRAENAKAIMRAQTILWNGPVGVFELGPFGGGTISTMSYMVQATKRGALGVIGGGDTGAAAAKFFYGNKPMGSQISFVSTGGGSSLVLMEGKMLPAIPALSDKA